MRLNAIGLILLCVALLSSSCQQEPAAEIPASSPVAVEATPQIGVAFVTVTSSSQLQTPEGSLSESTRPKPTNTPTPAPVTYRIQAGDTLVGIAAAKGLTLEELLALNPGIQPELLLVGQEIFLPPLPTAAAPTVDSPERPAELEIQGLTTYRAATGGTWLLGEVANVGQQAVELVQVRVSLLAPGGNELVSDILWLTPVTIPPGGKAPFGVRFPEVVSQDVAPFAEIVSVRPVNELGNRYLDLAVTDAEVTIGQSPIEVTGQLNNQGQSAAKNISIVTTFYDHRDAVTGFYELVLDDTLLPGDSEPFHFTALPPGGRADRYQFAIQAVVAE